MELWMMNALAKNDIQILDLNSSYDSTLTDELLFSIFTDIIGGGSSVYLFKQKCFSKSLEKLNITESNSRRYFKLARKGELVVVVFDNYTDIPGELFSHFQESSTDIPERLRSLGDKLARILRQTNIDGLPEGAAIFLHDLQYLLLLRLSNS
jgi:hypothetical protein